MRRSCDDDVVEIRLLLTETCQHLLYYRLENGRRARKPKCQVVYLKQPLICRQDHVTSLLLVELELQVSF